MRARASTVLTATPDAAPMLAHFEFHFRQLIERADSELDDQILALDVSQLS